MKKRKSSGNFIGIGLLCLLFLCVAVFSIFFVCCSKPSSDSSEETIPPPKLFPKRAAYLTIPQLRRKALYLRPKKLPQNRRKRGI